MSALRLCWLHCALGLFATSARADVLVVDASGMGDFTDIQPAIDAAADGDLVLVNPGVFQGFTILDKSVSVVARSTATVSIDGSVIVQHLAAARYVELAGLNANLAAFDLPAM
jgi:polygalacturonase